MGLTETFKPCTIDYSDCIDCPQFEECIAKEYIADGKSHLWLPIYLAALLGLIIYIVV